MMMARWTYPVLATIYSVLSLIACVSAWNDSAIDRAPVVAMILMALVLFSSWLWKSPEVRTATMAIGLLGLIGSAIWAGIAEDDLRPIHIIVRTVVSALFAGAFFWRERSLAR